MGVRRAKSLKCEKSPVKAGVFCFPEPVKIAGRGSCAQGLCPRSRVCPELRVPGVPKMAPAVPAVMTAVCAGRGGGG